jgi:hypothetical protein
MRDTAGLRKGKNAEGRFHFSREAEPGYIVKSDVTVITNVMERYQFL